MAGTVPTDAESTGTLDAAPVQCVWLCDVMRHYGLNPGTVICSPRGPKTVSVSPS